MVYIILFDFFCKAILVDLPALTGSARLYHQVFNGEAISPL